MALRFPVTNSPSKLLAAKRDLFLLAAQAFAKGEASARDLLDAHHELSLAERIIGQDAGEAIT